MSNISDEEIAWIITILIKYYFTDENIREIVRLLSSKATKSTP